MWEPFVCCRYEANATPGTQNAFAACRGQKSSYSSARVISVFSLLPPSMTAPRAEPTRPSLHSPLLGQAFSKHKLIRADLRSPVVRRASAIDMMSDLAQLTVGRQEAGWICCGSPACRRNSTPRALTRGRLALQCLSMLSSQSGLTSDL